MLAPHNGLHLSPRLGLEGFVDEHAGALPPPGVGVPAGRGAAHGRQGAPVPRAGVRFEGGHAEHLHRELLALHLCGQSKYRLNIHVLTYVIICNNYYQ